MVRAFAFVAVFVLAVIGIGIGVVGGLPLPPLQFAGGVLASDSGAGRAHIAFAVMLDCNRSVTISLGTVRLLPVPGYPLPSLTSVQVPPTRPPASAETRFTCEPTSPGDDVTAAVWITNSTGAGSIDAAAGLNINYESDGRSFTLTAAAGGLLCWSTAAFSCGDVALQSAKQAITAQQQSLDGG
jgi:hypothetical protein